MGPYDLFSWLAIAAVVVLVYRAVRRQGWGHMRPMFAFVVIGIPVLIAALALADVYLF